MLPRSRPPRRKSKRVRTKSYRDAEPGFFQFLVCRRRCRSRQIQVMRSGGSPRRLSRSSRLPLVRLSDFFSNLYFSSPLSSHSSSFARRLRGQRFRRLLGRGVGEQRLSRRRFRCRCCSSRFLDLAERGRGGGRRSLRERGGAPRPPRAPRRRQRPPGRRPGPRRRFLALGGRRRRRGLARRAEDDDGGGRSSSSAAAAAAACRNGGNKQRRLRFFGVASQSQRDKPERLWEEAPTPGTVRASRRGARHAAEAEAAAARQGRRRRQRRTPRQLPGALSTSRDRRPPPPPLLIRPRTPPPSPFPSAWLRPLRLRPRRQRRPSRCSMRSTEASPPRRALLGPVAGYRATGAHFGAGLFAQQQQQQPLRCDFAAPSSATLAAAARAALLSLRESRPLPPIRCRALGARHPRRLGRGGLLRRAVDLARTRGAPRGPLAAAEPQLRRLGGGRGRRAGGGRRRLDRRGRRRARCRVQQRRDAAASSLDAPLRSPGDGRSSISRSEERQ